MKKITTTFLLITSIAFSQNYQTVEEVNNACATLGFTANEDAEIAVDNIMEVIGLQKNFTLQECPNINNAVAKNITDESGNIKRYILYDNEFFSKMDIKAGSDWAAISILAHEIGHHLNGHSLNNEGSNHEFELDADYFSGLILSKMGATLEETQSAINTLRYEKSSTTHPAKLDRLNEIERGWTKGSNYKKKTDVTDYPDIMEPLVQEIYEKAKNGDRSAQFNLAYAYQTGNGIEKDYDEASRWYRKAAEQGELSAQTNLGIMYSNGIGVEQDYDEALKWWRKAAEQGKASAEFIMGYSYQMGEGVEKDYDEAVKWYQKAAEQGEAFAQSSLGYMYFSGYGVEKDYYEALKWHRKAAEQGNATGQANLGYLYYNGYGVTKSEAKGIFWYKKAAKQGNKSAKDELTKMGESW